MDLRGHVLRNRVTIGDSNILRLTRERAVPENQRSSKTHAEAAYPGRSRL